MDQAIRNKLRNVVTQCRKLLEEAVSQMLQGQFGIYATSKKEEVHVEDEARMKNLSEEDKGYRQDILAHFEHIQALSYKPKDALAQLVREVAFTHLNRLCAYKMMEAREVWVGGQRFREAVSRGLKSQGFQFYLADHPEDKQRFDTGQQDVAYRHFLGWLGVLLSEEIGVLFSPTDPANRLFPPQRVLDEVLALLNSDDLKDIWAEDETIGWAYQYFTPKELRDQVRKESAAPRNSYELAFRNQFFTPRYVVEFLTDNTLGRMWYEMRKGNTKLKDQCRYMVRRPSEVFLAEEQTPPEPKQNQEELSQEELLKQPVHIPHRAKKDPRELRILDPACGSGHFLLYCFDLLLTIYDEAYADPDLGPKLKEDYPTLEALRQDTPRLILAHNLHGIDIDLRASQIAALALWLRCQRAYREMGLTQDRPKITKSNIVCAEPMPGEKEMLDEFLKTLKQDRLEALIRRVMQVPEGSRVRATESMVESLNELVRLVWNKMQLAGEAGSLLKVEEELQEAVRKGQEEWEEKQPLFRFTEFSLTEKPKESYVRYVPGEGVSFWQRAEALVLEALRDYARHTANGGRLQRQLFADDAAHGFAFIDTCQKRFDVALMNPPFGTGTPTAARYVNLAYPRSKNDLYSACVERGLGFLRTEGMVGAITSRTGFFLSSFSKWREDLLLPEARLSVLADLGFGVLDAAKVETAAYCLSIRSAIKQGVFFRLLGETNISKALAEAAGSIYAGNVPSFVFLANPDSFRQIPGSPYAYWVSERTRHLFKALPAFESDGRAVKQGLATADDFRFVRAWWEVPSSCILTGSHGASRNDFRQETRLGKQWVPIVKGGVNTPFHGDVILVANWNDEGRDLREFQGSVIRNPDYYFRPGITWPARPWLRGFFSFVPAGALFTHTGMMLFLPEEDRLAVCSILNSDAYAGLLHLLMARGMGVETDQTLKYEVGYISSVPIPAFDAQARKRLELLSNRCHEQVRFFDTVRETSHFFIAPAVTHANADSLSAIAQAWSKRIAHASSGINECRQEINEIAFELYGVDSADRKSLEDGLDKRTAAKTVVEHEEIGGSEDNSEVTGITPDIISYCIGCAFGRWDIRVATGERRPNEFSSPFSPLPACSPGMLQGSDGPSTPQETVEPPLRIDSDSIIPDDPDHSDDIVRRVREVLELIWKDRAEAIEKEACEILGVRELRDYFRKPGTGGFWDDHVARYSKSRRKAPIYWLLQSSKKTYALWLYYHRLDKDILFKALLNYVEPKIRLEHSRLDSLRSQKTALGTAKGTKKIDKDIERQEALMVELKDFEDKLRRAAYLDFGKNLDSSVIYDPDLNDGVVLNIAPLWELVPWKEAKNYWEELLAGEYEWSSMGKLLRKKGLVQ